MNRDAFDGARDRLERAKEAVAELERHRITSLEIVSETSAPINERPPRKMQELPPFKAERAAWWQFLLATSGVYSKLELGAKGYAKSEGWYTQRKGQRKADPMLHYLHQARNAEEHGIRGSSYAVGMRATNPGRGVKIINNEHGELVHLEVPEDIPLGAKVAQLIPAGLRLVPVVDGRSRRTFSPPREHLGLPIPVEPPLSEDHPLTLARPALRYLEEMLHDAERLIVD